jgi:hypothetical protein
MDGIIELIWKFAPRLLVCLLFTIAAVFLIVWLVPEGAAQSRALRCVAAVGIIGGIAWEAFARCKIRPRP